MGILIFSFDAVFFVSADAFAVVVLVDIPLPDEALVDNVLDVHLEV